MPSYPTFLTSSLSSLSLPPTSGNLRDLINGINRPATDDLDLREETRPAQEISETSVDRFHSGGDFRSAAPDFLRLTFAVQLIVVSYIRGAQRSLLRFLKKKLE